MKLKKIASLALAGVMALSMLAGCANGTNNDNNTNNDVNVGGATGISAKVQSELAEKDTIKLSDNATYTGYLASAIKKADLDATALNTLNTGAPKWVEGGDVYTEIDDLMNNNVVDYATANKMSSYAPATDSNANAANSKVYVGVYVVNGDVSEEIAVQKLVDAIDAVTEDKVPTTLADDNSKYYSHEYTGSVSVQKVSDGSISSWIFMVVLADEATKL